MVNKPLSTLEETFLADETKPGEKTKLIGDILVDADALVALAKSDDSNHKAALRISEKLQEEGVFWFLSPFTLAEATTVLSYKVSHEAAKEFLKATRKLKLPVFPLKDEDIELADRWFFKQKKKGTSYFDCYNLALLERYKRFFAGIFSFDGIYSRNGFTTASNLLTS